VSGEKQNQKNPPLVEGEKTMKKLMTSTLLTLAAVPFLMAAPTVAKKAQNTTPAATPAATAKSKTAKHTKKSSKTSTAKPAPAATPSK
jgi:hypothetical protein